MRTNLRIVGAAFVAALIARTAFGEAPSAIRTWTFEEDGADLPPAGFTFARTDGGRLGRWLVRPMAGAPSGEKVVVQLDDDPTRDRYLIAVGTEPVLRDLRVSVRCKPIAGKIDQACGLVFRYRDESNYYLTRANALEGNVRLYYFRDGKRQQLASWSGAVQADRWSELRAETRGDHLVVHWNAEKVIDAHDATFVDAGRSGLWTKADSVTAFDDFTVAPAEPTGTAP